MESVLTIGRSVTVENGDFNWLCHYAGKRAKVLRVSGPFAMIDIEDVGLRGCLVEYLQVMPTAAEIAQRFAQRDLAGA